MAKAKKPAESSAPAPAPEAQAPTAPASPANVATPKKSNKTLWIVLAVLGFFLIVVPAVVVTAGVFWFKKNVTTEKVTENIVEGALEKATGSNNVNIDTEKGSFSVEGDNGESFSFGSDQELPEDFPKSKVPYIKEKNVTSVLTSSDSGKKSWWVSTYVDDSYTKATDFFEQKIAEPTYNDVSSYSFGDSMTITGSDSSYQVTGTASKPSDSSPATMVTYAVPEK